MYSEEQLREKYGSYAGAIMDTKQQLQGYYAAQEALDKQFEKENDPNKLAEMRKESDSNNSRIQQLEGDIMSYEEAGTNEVIEENMKNAQPAEAVSNGSAIKEQNISVGSTSVTSSVKTMGNGSGLLNAQSTSYKNGNHVFQTDLAKRTINTTENQMANMQNSVSSTGGNNSSYVNGLNECASGSRTAIIGNPAAVQKGLTTEADDLKKDLVAARSGFNDDRNQSPFTIINDLISFPGKVVSKIVKTVESVAEDTDVPKVKMGTSLFASIYADIIFECARYSEKYAKILSASSIEVGKTVALNEVEKKQKQMEIIMKMPDSPLKERILSAVKKGDLTAIFAKPNNEGIEKKDTFDYEDYDKKTKEYVKQVIELERACS